MKFETPCACTTLRRAARAVTAAYDAALAPSGLRITQFSILRKLARLGPLPVTRLAAEAALDRPTMGRNLNPLERRGLVRIEVGNVDQRERVAYLTAAGEAAIEAALRTGARLKSGSRPWCSLPLSASSPIGSTSRGRVSSPRGKEQEDQEVQCIPDIQREPRWPVVLELKGP
jgi:DNA-binding MarR family transcriptional regulator